MVSGIIISCQVTFFALAKERSFFIKEIKPSSTRCPWITSVLCRYCGQTGLHCSRRLHPLPFTGRMPDPLPFVTHLVIWGCGWGSVWSSIERLDSLLFVQEVTSIFYQCAFKNIFLLFQRNLLINYQNEEKSCGHWPRCAGVADSNTDWNLIVYEVFCFLLLFLMMLYLLSFKNSSCTNTCFMKTNCQASTLTKNRCLNHLRGTKSVVLF